MNYHNKYQKYKYLYNQLLKGGSAGKSFSRKQINNLVDDLSMELAQLENKIQSSIKSCS